MQSCKEHAATVGTTHHIREGRDDYEADRRVDAGLGGLLLFYWLEHLESCNHWPLRTFSPWDIWQQLLHITNSRRPAPDLGRSPDRLRI